MKIIIQGQGEMSFTKCQSEKILELKLNCPTLKAIQNKIQF